MMDPKLVQNMAFRIHVVLSELHQSISPHRGDPVADGALKLIEGMHDTTKKWWDLFLAGRNPHPGPMIDELRKAANKMLADANLLEDEMRRVMRAA